MLNRIKEVCTEVAGIEVSPHHFHVHQYGAHTELTFHIALDGMQSLTAAHSLADKMEKQINEIFAVEATIHIEPVGDSETEKDIEQDVFS